MTSLELGQAQRKLLTRRNISTIGFLIGTSAVIVFLMRGLVIKTAAISYLDVPSNWVSLFREAGLNIIFAPFAIVAAILLWLSIGALVLLHTMVDRNVFYSWPDFVLRSFGISFVVYILIISIAKIIFPTREQPLLFYWLIVPTLVMLWLLLVLRVRKGGKIITPLATASDQRRMIWTIIIPFTLLVIMLPHFFWQEFNDDGLEALEIGRSLSTYILPRFPTTSGVVGLGIGMLPMAFPVHWFVSLYGPIEIAARAPMALYLPVLFNLMILLIEYNAPKRLGLMGESLVILGLTVFTIAISYNASYDPYISDIAAPAAFEVLTIIAILGTIYSIWSDANSWFYFFAVLAFLCRPTGLLILLLLGIAILLILHKYRRRWLVNILITMLILVVFSAIYDRLLLPYLSGTNDIGYQASGLIDRVRYIRLIDLKRINYGLFASGIIPFLALFLFFWQDEYGKFLSFITLCYYLIFLIVAHTALHHFVPAMVIPMIVFWRMFLFHSEWNSKIIYPLVAGMGFLALWLSLPQSFELHRTYRNIGQKTEIRIGNYDNNYWAIKRYEKLFWKLFPPDWFVVDRSKELVLTPSLMIYYATREKQGDGAINYIVQMKSDPVPEGYKAVTGLDDGLIYVKDENMWLKDRYQNFQTNFRSPIYSINRSTLFNFWNDEASIPIIDLMQLGGKVKRFILGEIRF